MNAYDLWHLRAGGFAGPSVKTQGSNFWSKRNCPVERLTAHYDAGKRFAAPQLLTADESLREIYATHLPHVWRERRIHVGHVNKVFASSWLNEHELVLGTKCNKLLICCLNGQSDRMQPLAKDRRCRKRDRWRRMIVQPDVPVGPTQQPAAAASSSSQQQQAQAPAVYDSPNLQSTAPARFLCPSGELLIRVPQLKGTHRSKWRDTEDTTHGGIHCLRINPSGTMLVTGASNPADLAVYSLPDFRPLTVGEGAHSDWMFDFAWLDDQVGISGSRDGSISAWRFDVDALIDERHRPHCKHVPILGATDEAFYGTPAPQRYVSSQAVDTVRLSHFDRVRALSFSEPRRHVMATSLAERVCTLDVCTMRKTGQLLLDDYHELVCVAHNGDGSVAALGSRSHVIFVDDKNLSIIKNVQLPSKIRHDHDHEHSLYGAGGYTNRDYDQRRDTDNKSCRNQTGVRSIAWNGPLVSIGTGSSELLFFDLRTQKFVPCCGRSCSRDLCLVATDPLQRYDDMLYMDGAGMTSTAIYTHSYDPSGTRLFAAGGPIAANIQGSYAALWL